MRIKIIGDGTLGRTKVVNEETGEILDGVSSVSWTLDPGLGISRCVLELNRISIDLDVDVTKILSKYPSGDARPEF